MHVLIANIIALIASVLMFLTGFLKKKGSILIVQTIQIGLSAVSNLILGGITGAIVNVISMIRNIFCYYGKLGILIKVVVTILTVSLCLLFNNFGIIGLLPVVSTVSYVWLMNIKDVRKFKYLLIFTLVLWGIYEFSIQSYTAAAFDVMTIVANIISLMGLSSDAKKKPARVGHQKSKKRTVAKRKGSNKQKSSKRSR